MSLGGWGGCVVRLGLNLEPESGVETPSLPCFLSPQLPLSPFRTRTCTPLCFSSC